MVVVGNEDVNREKIHDLVSVFYQPTFKTFYVNSEDGENICKPLGVFVSLGITTSMNVLNNIKDIINDNKEYSAKLVEISSKKENDIFINRVTSNEPKQYFLGDGVPKDVVVMTREESMNELENLKNLMTPESDLDTLKEEAPKVSRLKYLIEKLDESNGWGAHRIQKESGTGYRIYHMYVNYKKTDDNLEYRIGIFVNDKQSEVLA
jgi:hypothetical protein